MTTTAAHYFLPEDYQENPVCTPRDRNHGRPYWNPVRIRASRYYQHSIYARAGKLIRQKSLSSLLDVGCGCGMKLARIHSKFPNLKIVGLDQEHAIGFCRKQHAFGTWISADLDNPQSINLEERFELILCADVIEHLSNPDSLLQLIRSRLSQDGFVLISTIDRDRLYRGTRKSPQNPEHIREWNVPEFRQYLQSRGFPILAGSHTFPTRIGPNPFFIKELIHQIRSFKTLRYVQVYLLQNNGLSS